MHATLSIITFEHVFEVLSLRDRWRLCSVSRLWREGVETTSICRITCLNEFLNIPSSQLASRYINRVCSTILRIEAYDEDEPYLPAYHQAFILPALSNLTCAHLVPYSEVSDQVNVAAWSNLLFKAKSSLKTVEFTYELGILGEDNRAIHASAQQFYFLGRIFPVTKTC